MISRPSESEAVVVAFSDVSDCALPDGIEHVFWLDFSGDIPGDCAGASSETLTFVYGARSARDFTENSDFFKSRDSLVICTQNPGNAAFLASLLTHFTIVDFSTSPDTVFVYLAPKKLSNTGQSLSSLSGILENLQRIQNEDRRYLADELQFWESASLRAETPEYKAPELSRKQTGLRKRLKVRMVKYLKPYVKFLPTPFYQQALKIWNSI